MLDEILVELFQLRFRHVRRVPVQQLHHIRRDLNEIRTHIVDDAQVGSTHHVIILVLDHVVRQAVQFAAIQKVARSALKEQVGKPLCHAGRGHISVLVLLSVPPVQQEVRTDLHQRKHSSLGDLAHHCPVQVLSGPLHFFCCLAAGCSLVPGLLGVVVHHRIGQDAVVLEPLGREHGQNLNHLIRVALDPRPLHGGVVGLGLLDHSLIGLVHRLPVGIILLDLGSPIRGAVAGVG